MENSTETLDETTEESSAESIEQKAERLERALLEVKRKLGKSFGTRLPPVDLKTVPLPGDVRPGQVWDQDRCRFVPYDAAE